MQILSSCAWRQLLHAGPACRVTGATAQEDWRHVCCACGRWAQDLAGLDALPPLDASGLRAAGGPEEAPALAQGLPELRRKAKASTVLEKLRMLRTPA